MLDGFILWIQSIFVVCPKCHRMIDRPVYLCEECGTEHRNLVPWFGSVFYRTCSCGKRLPTTRIFGRTSLTAACPFEDCGQLIGKRAEDSQIIAFSVVGGPSSGKTAFLMSAVHELTGKIAILKHWNVVIPLSGDRTLSNRWAQYMHYGHAPQKTNVRQPTAFTLEVLNNGLCEKKRICFYDPAGEVFRESGSLSEHNYHQFMEGMIFIIDPFSIPEVARIFRKGINAKHAELEVIEKSPEDYCETLLISLGKDHNLTPERLRHVPCAIVLTKVDAFNLDDFIGEKSARKLMSRHPGLSFEDAIDSVCRHSLIQWGMGNLVTLLEDNFSTTRCFSVSAFGHLKGENKPFQPLRVEQPLMWLLDRAGVDSRMGKEGVMLALGIIAICIGAFALLAFWVAGG